MLKSYHSKQFAVSIKLMGGGVLVGLFKAMEKKIVIHEFTGIYEHRNQEVIDLSFSIDWQLDRHESTYATTFTGVIESKGFFEVLTLKWILVDLNEFNTCFLNTGIMTFNDLQHEASLVQANLNPFPEFGIEIEPEYE